MKDEFRKYATRHLGMNSMVLDDVISAQNRFQSQYLNPYILEERQLNVTQMDVFSRLMMDRIIFLGTEIDDYTANTLQAQLLFLDSADPGRRTSFRQLRVLPAPRFLPVRQFLPFLPLRPKVRERFRRES